MCVPFEAQVPLADVAAAPGCFLDGTAMPSSQTLPPDLVEEGHAIPIPRVGAMHEGRRRARARRAAGS